MGNDLSPGRSARPVLRSVGRNARIPKWPARVTDEWRISAEELEDDQFDTVRYRIDTPSGALNMVVQANAYTSWVAEFLVKEKRDVELIAAYAPHPNCDGEAINRLAETFGERGLDSRSSFLSISTVSRGAGRTPAA